MIIRDQMQREIQITLPLKRIISLVPSQTELLVDLGLEANIAGITKFCVHPPYLKKQKKVVGGTKTVHFNKIRALNPDIILCNKEENTEEMVKELEKIAPVHVSNIISIEDSLDLINQYGLIFNKETEATTLITAISNQLINFKAEVRPALKVAYVIWRQPWMLAGKNTFIDTLLELNGWENVIVDSPDRYPELTLEEIKNLNPDLVLLSSEPFPFKQKHKTEILEQLDCRVELVDGEYFSWYGSRLLPALSYFKEFQNGLTGR